MHALQVDGLTKSYFSGSHALTVLRDVSLSLSEGESCAIVGPSGSGKTTLLGLCAGLDRPSSGSVTLQGVCLDRLNEDERARLRNLYVGFVFQNFNLIPTLTTLENVLVPLELRGKSDSRAVAENLLERVGIGERLEHYPAQLSGGEQQRVAIARAFVNRPKILFADEPTGNLDADTSQRVVDLLFELNREARTTLIMATHNLELAGRNQRVIKLKGGAVLSDGHGDPASW